MIGPCEVVDMAKSSGPSTDLWGSQWRADEEPKADLGTAHSLKAQIGKLESSSVHMPETLDAWLSVRGG